MRRAYQRRGIALLEVLAATTILMLAILGWFSLFGQLRHSLEDALQREAGLRRASSALAFAAAMPVESLDAWQSGRRFAEFALSSRRVSIGTYDLLASDSLTGALILGTTVWVHPRVTESPP